MLVSRNQSRSLTCLCGRRAWARKQRPARAALHPRHDWL